MKLFYMLLTILAIIVMAWSLGIILPEIKNWFGSILDQPAFEAYKLYGV